MFKGLVKGYLLSRLRDVLLKLISANFYYLQQIRRDNFRMLLAYSCLQSYSFVQQEGYTGKQKIVLYSTTLMTLTAGRENLLHLSISLKSTELHVSDVFLHTVNKLRKITTLTEHTEAETKNTVLLLLPYVDMPRNTNNKSPV